MTWLGIGISGRANLSRANLAEIASSLRCNPPNPEEC